MTAPFLILHLSDLHFGPHCRFAGQDMANLARRFHQAVEAARADLGIAEHVGLIIATGDIAEAALPVQYREAQAFFEGLVAELGIARRRVLFVPGNHDVCWPLCRRVELDQQLEGFADPERERRIHAVKLEPYRAFLDAFYGQPRAELDGVTELGPAAFVHALPELGVSVALLDSCELESHRPADHRGVLGKDQAQALMSHWRQAGELVKIAAIHHNPVATVPAGVRGWVEYLQGRATSQGLTPELLAHFAADAVGFEGRELLRAVADDCRVSIILHGHHHASAREAWTWQKHGPGQTHVLSAGSWGLIEDKLPEGQPLVMHLLRVDPGAHEIRSILRVYEPRARAAGQVEPGEFVADPAEPRGCRLALSVAASAAGRETVVGVERGTSEPAGVDGMAARARELVREYRLRLKRRYDRWDLGGVGAVQAGGARQPITAGLDEMYLPLRLDPNIDPEELEAGVPLEPHQVLLREQALVIRGAAGTGKTTWMRWTFRRLIDMEQALPFMLELRALARAWTKHEPRAGERTIDACLRDWMAECVGPGWGHELGELLPWLLRSRSGPRPILLIDGWDELGDLGDELRERLVSFLDAHSRVLAVVTSRPYGHSRPSHSDSFESLDIQPLSDPEIEVLASRFFAAVHGGDVREAETARQRFQDALEHAPDARSLARTPLLLTMMLLISRDRPLPDKRHALYHACIENLLSARPARREAEGARLTREQWRPDDSSERLRVVAEVACRMQEDVYRSGLRGQIVGEWDEVVALLPGSWTDAQRHGFVAWLLGASGLMVDRADGTVAFAHLSFQEYLTAWHLHVKHEGAEARVQLCCERMQRSSWWETLRLWAALIEGRDPGQLAPVLDALTSGNILGDAAADQVRQKAAAFWLAGAMLADGLGPDAMFEHWVARLDMQFDIAGHRHASACARAWAASRQRVRHTRIEETWADLGRTWSWLRWQLAENWREEAALSVMHTAPSVLAEPIIGTLNTDDAITDSRTIAFSRALSGASPWWPEVPLELVILRLWPGLRPILGARLQTLVSLGGGYHELVVAGQQLLLLRGKNREIAHEFAQHVMGDLDRGLAEQVVRDLTHYFAQHLAWGLDREIIQNRDRTLARELTQSLKFYFVRHFAWYFARGLGRDTAREFARHLVRDWAGFSAQRLNWDWPLHFVAPFAQQLGLSPDLPWVRSFVLTELASIFGRASLRAILARTYVDDPLLLVLFQKACRASLGILSGATALDRSLAELPPDTDPLWPALARHVARRATPEDRALLEDLARHPDQREPPLSWGLKYYVRGDIMLADGTELTLDELCDQAGLPRLPYLEDMPDEIAATP